MTGVNLSNADLRLADLTGADLTGADLRGSNLLNSDLHLAEVSGAKFDNAFLYLLSVEQKVEIWKNSAPILIAEGNLSTKEDVPVSPDKFQCDRC